MVAENLKLIIQAEATSAINELKKFTVETNNAKSGVSKFQQNITAWAKGMAAAYISVRTLQAALRYGFDASKMAAEAKQISTALDSMAESYGTTANSIIASLKKASGGTISELELMQSASKAALFDLPLNQLDRLMEIARASATATGQSVQYMFDSIVTGISRGSPLILDNLGLTLKIGEATEKYANSIGKTTEELTAEERKMATLNATLEAGGKIIEKVNSDTNELTALQKWQQYQATMKDLRLEIGKFMLPAFEAVTEEATQFAKNLKEIVELRNIMRNIADGTATTTERMKALTAQIREAQRQQQELAEFGGEELNKGRIVALQNELEWLKKAQYYESLKTAGSLKAAEEAKKAADVEKKRAEEALRLLDEIDSAYKKTPEGARAALEAQIAMWEGHLKTAGSNGPKIISIIRYLKEELAGMDDEPVEAVKTLAEQMEEFYRGIEQGPTTAAFADWLAFIEENKEALPELADDWRELADANAAFAVSLGRTSLAAEIQKERLEEIKEQFQQMRMAITPFADAFGAMIVNAKDGAEAFKEAMKGAFAAVLEMLAKEAFARAGLAFAAGNFVGSALWAAAGTAALVAKGAVQALGEGGIVTKPTHALIGERGPEAVIPLNKAGAMGPTIIVNVQGSVLEEEGLARRISKVVAGVGRGY